MADGSAIFTLTVGREEAGCAKSLGSLALVIVPPVSRRIGRQANHDLMALSNVVKALVENRRFVPYRDSVLTRLLRHAFGHSCYTRLVLCVNGDAAEDEERNLTDRAAGFAERAKRIVNNPAVNNVDNFDAIAQLEPNLTKSAGKIA